MATPPRGRPPSTASPPDRGRNMLTALGGGVLVLAVAGGAWVLFGRDSENAPTSAIGPTVPTSSPTPPVFGPVVPGAKPTPTVSPTSVKPVATPKSVATTSSTPAPAKTAAATPTATPKATTAPAPKPTATTTAPQPAPPVAKPPVTAPQQGGTVAKKAYTFKVARGDTLWDLTTKVLADTGRSTSNANVAAFVQKLYSSNQGVVGSDPNLILVGQTITWPSGL